MEVSRMFCRVQMRAGEQGYEIQSWVTLGRMSPRNPGECKGGGREIKTWRGDVLEASGDILNRKGSVEEGEKGEGCTIRSVAAVL